MFDNFMALVSLFMMENIWLTMGNNWMALLVLIMVKN